MSQLFIRAFKEDLQRKKTVEYLKLKVLKNASKTFSDATIIDHLYGQDILDNHKIQIIKLIIEIYFKIRVAYE